MWDRIRRRFGYHGRAGREGANTLEQRDWDREIELDRDRPEFRDDFGEHYGQEKEGESTPAKRY